jgi:hypothetical protein
VRDASRAHARIWGGERLGNRRSYPATRLPTARFIKGYAPTQALVGGRCLASSAAGEAEAKVAKK